VTNRERIIFILLVFVTFFVGFSIGRSLSDEDLSKAKKKAYSHGESVGYERGLNIPQSIGQTQKILQELGFYKGRIDNIWGKNTDRAFCDWCAEQHFTVEIENLQSQIGNKL